MSQKRLQLDFDVRSNLFVCIYSLEPPDDKNHGCQIFQRYGAA